MSERRRLAVAGEAGIETVEATVSTEPPWTLTLTFPDGRVTTAQAPDLFSALEAVRLELEGGGLLACCQGARPDVFPSGMSRQMAGGRRAYRLRAGRRATEEDLVDILDPAGCDDVVAVQEQHDAVQRFHAG